MKDKYTTVAEFVAATRTRSVLDVGCRDCVLRDEIERHAPGVGYVGIDLSPDGRTVPLVADLSVGLPVADRSMETVVALDVLEHLDDLGGGLDELVRVARRHIVVVLPNLAHVTHRVNFAIRGKLRTGKYDLALDTSRDRHRWLTVIPQIDDYVRGYARRHGLAVLNRVDLSAGPRTAVVERILARLGFSRSWHVASVLYVLEKPEPVET